MKPKPLRPGDHLTPEVPNRNPGRIVGVPVLRLNSHPTQLAGILTNDSKRFVRDVEEILRNRSSECRSGMVGQLIMIGGLALIGYLLYVLHVTNRDDRK